MESTPEFSKSKSKPKPTTNSTSSPPLSSDPLQVEESPIFSYISNLSPLKPDKATPVTQGFPGINSPPLVFRSPEIIQKSRPSFLRRPQFARSSDAGFSGQHENFEATVTGMEESRRSNDHLSSGLSRTCLDKANDASNSSPEKASSSPSGCVDDYLTEAVIMGDGGSASSANLTPKNSDDIFHSQTDLLDLESVDNKEDKDDCRNDEMVASPVILKQGEEDNQKKSLTNLKPFVPIEKSGDDNIPLDMCPKVEPVTSEDHALDNRHEAENAECCHMFEVGSTSPLESLHIAEECGSCCENAGGPCTDAVENKMHDHSPKVVQHQHGMSRCVLQFEDAQGKMKINIGFQISSGSAGHSTSSAGPGDSEVLESASLKKQTSPSSKLFDNMTLPISSPETSGIYNVNVPKRSGIGLHLNSIVNPMLMGSGAKVSMKSTERVISDGAGKKLISIMGCDLCKNCSIASKVAEGVSVSRNTSRHDTCTAASSATLSPYGMKPLYEAVLLKPIECQSNPSNKRIFKSETFDSYEDFGQSSPKKKRKKTLVIGDNNGCKRCNCKKTKCLKLYCDCFAAGIYCAEPCACQGCFNRPEYEATVLETRQQIESRNPLAFAPKIVQQITEPATNISAEDGGHFTPSSARHKIGCNCKKSKCLKKYCECYQANVGCSIGCRCEACENVYGRKGEYDRTKGLFSKEDNSSMHDSSFDKMDEPVASKDDFLHNELCNSHYLTPLTPSFQCPNHGKGGSKPWFSSERYLPSPDSAIKAPCGMTPGQATNPDNHNIALVTNPEIMDLLSIDQDLGYGNEHTVSQITPRCDANVLSNVGHLTAPPNPQYWTNTLRAQMFPGNHQVSSASSLRWRSSPVTPTNFEGTKLHQVVDFDVLYNTKDDSTPDILKETPVPPDAVKVSSPNKKRVSSHGGGMKLASSSLAGLRTGRKFILQAVPSFPSLTPCINTKGGSDQNMNLSQNSSCSKRII